MKISIPNRIKCINFLICISFLTLSFRHEIASISLYLAVFLSIIEIVTKKTNIFKVKNTIVIFLVYYFLIEIIGLVYTENLYFGMKDIESKLLFIVGPLIILANSKNGFNVTNFIRSYILGITINLFYLIIEGCLFYQQNQTPPKYLEFSILMHPTYYSFYLVLAIILILEFRDKLIKNKSLLSILLILFSIGVILTDSKAGVICFFLTLLFYSIKFILNFKFRMKIIISIISIISIFIIIKQLSKSRIMELTSKLQTSTQFDNYNGIYNSTEQRIIIWRASKKIIKENFLFGTGTGDIKDELKNQFLITNYTEGINKNFNCHNQFLQIIGTFGVILSIPIFILFFKLFYSSIINKKIFLSFITLIFFINFMLESFLETKAGVEVFILYGFIYFSVLKTDNIICLSVSFPKIISSVFKRNL